MVLLSQLQQADAQQRAMLQVEGAQRLGLDLGLHPCLAGVFGQLAQVQALDLRRARAVHLAQALIGLLLEHTAQALVTFEQVAERLLQGGLVKCSLEADRTWQVIGTAVRIQLPEHPHALLGERGCKTVLRRHPGRNRELGKVDALSGQGFKEQAALFQRQFNETAGQLQGLFGIHQLAFRTSGYHGQCPAIPTKRIQPAKN
ncbi:hypothetical protein BR1R5_26860 [Pseudomonas sp. BR1R-5]|nr:hypothetical protein BR1R5_26860 [Pseudomonas sp. BR1R-5]